MRVLLLHNPTAGEPDTDAPRLIQAFEDAGHSVTYQSTQPDNWRDALDKPLDVVVAAGGDGTVRKTAIELAARNGRDVPMAIVPAGVANNIARSLGVGTAPHAIAQDLSGGRLVQLPIGIARAPWGTELFVESAGVGLTPLLEGPPEHTLAAGAERLLQHLRQAQPREIAVEIDGRDATGNYFLALAISTRSIGPQLELVSPAKALDGSLHVLLVGEAERELLVDTLDRVRREEPAGVQVEAQAAREVVMEWVGGLGHVDDAAWPEDRRASGRVTLTIETSLRVLVPPR